MYRRIAVLASLAVVAAMFVGSSTANAQSGGHCVFTGLAGNLVDNQNGAAGIPSAQKDFQGDGVLEDFEHGTYNYSGPATCSGVFEGQVVDPGVNNAFISSVGEYDNIVCGTGWAFDATGVGTTVTGREFQTGDPLEVSNVGYEIAFTGGVGALAIGTNEESTNPEHDGPITGDYTGGGAVNILPVGGDCATTDVNAFSVAGSFVAHG